MGRTPGEKNGLKRGPWTPEEDQKLVDYIHKHGYGNWRTLPKNAGLQRCGKSCRLRWTNYLRPDIKRGRFSFEEEEAIIHLHSILGNKWSAIASRLPGRTDNEIKNYWNTHIRKRLPRLELLDLSSLLTFSSSQLNAELLKLASSLFSSTSSSRSHHQHHDDKNDLNNTAPLLINANGAPLQEHINNYNNHIQIQNHHIIPQQVNNVDPNQSNFHHVFGSPSPQQHHCYSQFTSHNWHPTGGMASSSPFDATPHQLLPSTYDYYYNCSDDNHANNNFTMEPPLSQTLTTFQCSNNSNHHQNLSSLASVLSNTEDVISSNMMMMMGFEIPELLDVSDFL